MFGTLEKDIYTPATQMKDPLIRGVLIMTGNQVEDLEFFYPYYRFIEAGYRVGVATPEGGAFKAKHGLGLPESMKLTDVRPKEYSLLYIPGGKAPAELKKDHDALAIVHFFVKNQMPIAAICHGPQILAAAGVIRGKRISAWPEVEKEISDAGGIYQNAEVMCDGLFTTARWPADLPMHMKYVLKVLAAVGAVHGHQAAA